MTLVPAKSKLTCGPARLHLQNKQFCLVTGHPPRITGHWILSHLRKFGIVDGKFCFEGGTLCLKGTYTFTFLFMSLTVWNERTIITSSLMVIVVCVYSLTIIIILFLFLVPLLQERDYMLLERTELKSC